MATLLIVDDDILVRDMLRELLAPFHECHTADRAQQALAYLDMETYDAVLTDLSMPGLSGRALLKHIQAKHSATPVIVITGEFDETERKELLNLGAFAYFTKPFQLEEIEEAVGRAIARHQKLAGTNQDESTSDKSEDTPDTKPSSADIDAST